MDVQLKTGEILVFPDDAPNDAIARYINAKHPEEFADDYTPSEFIDDTAKGLQHGGVKAIQGGIGLLNLATGGHGAELVDKGMNAISGVENGSFTQQLAEDDARREAELSANARADIEQAQMESQGGFIDAVKAYATHPQALAHGIEESLPMMLGGAGVVRGASALGGLSTAQSLALSAGVEGAQQAGTLAEQAQRDGIPYDQYAAPAIASGVSTGVINAVSGRLFGDIATDLAVGSNTVKGGLLGKTAKGFLTEGGEETTQSVGETIGENSAYGREDLTQGMGSNAGAGFVMGGVMGAAGGGVSHFLNKSEGQSSPLGEQILKDEAPIDSVPNFPVTNPTDNVSDNLNDLNARVDAILNPTSQQNPIQQIAKTETIDEAIGAFNDSVIMPPVPSPVSQELPQLPPPVIQDETAFEQPQTEIKYPTKLDDSQESIALLDQFLSNGAILKGRFLIHDNKQVTALTKTQKDLTEELLKNESDINNAVLPITEPTLNPNVSDNAPVSETQTETPLQSERLGEILTNQNDGATSIAENPQQTVVENSASVPQRISSLKISDDDLIHYDSVSSAAYYPDNIVHVNSKTPYWAKLLGEKGSITANTPEELEQKISAYKNEANNQVEQPAQNAVENTDLSQKAANQPVSYDNLDGLLKRPSDNTPFKDEKSANTRFKLQKLSDEDYAVVPVKDGYAIAPIKAMDYQQFKALPDNAPFSDDVIKQSFEALTGKVAPDISKMETTENSVIEESSATGNENLPVDQQNNEMDLVDNSTSIETHKSLESVGDKLSPVQTSQSQNVTNSTGKTVTLSTPKQDLTVDANYEVLPVSSVITSHDDNLRVNPQFPQELQPRNRSAKSYEIDLQNKVANFNPARVGESATTDSGAPIIDVLGNVISGNGRAIAINKLPAQKASEYKQFLLDNAENFGLNRADIEAIERPVLVRRLTDSSVNLGELARKSNDSAIKEMSVVEQAFSDADSVDEETFTLYDGGKLTTNRSFVSAFIQGTGVDNIYDTDGMLSQKGINRIESAIMAKAYGNEKIVADLYENADTEVKSLLNALLKSSSNWLKLRAVFAETGTKDLTPHLVEAVMLVKKARMSGGQTVKSLISQRDLMSGDNVHPLTEKFVKLFFYDANLSKYIAADKVADILNAVSQNLAKSLVNADVFGENLTPTQILDKVYEQHIKSKQESKPAPKGYLGSLFEPVVTRGDKRREIERRERDGRQSVDSAGVENARRDTGGLKYSYAGAKAQNADQSALARAVEMQQQGIDNETIRKETGWFLGYDERWKFEISDKSFTIKDFEADFDETDKRSFDEGGRIFVRLDKVLKHEKLQKAYPDLFNDLYVNFNPNNILDSASFSAQSSVIEVGAKYSKDGTISFNTSALLHEIQHAIQTIEGFARGGTANEFELNPIKESVYKKTLDTHNETLGAYVNGLRERWKKGELEISEVKTLAEQEAKKLNIPKYEKILKNSKDPFKAYERLAGEIEARDTQSRMNLTDKQRRDSTPYVSQGISKEDAIVRFGDGVSEMAARPAPEKTVGEFAARILANPEDNAWFKDFGKVNEERRADIFEQTGVDVKDANLVIFASTINHSFSGHDDLTIKDWNTLESVITDFDIVKRGIEQSGMQDERLLFVKNINGASYVATVERAVSTRKGVRLNVVTYFKDNENKINGFLKTHTREKLEADRLMPAGGKFPADANNSSESKQIFLSGDKNIPQAYTKSTLETALRQIMDGEHGNGWFDRLFATGKFKIISSEDAKTFTDKSGIQAFYNESDDTTYFIHDGIDKDTDLKGLMLHELGIHALKAGKDTDGFNKLLKSVETLVKTKNAKAVEAHQAAKDAGTNEADILEETAAYLVEKYPNLLISQKIIAWFKNAIRDLSVYFKGADKLHFVQWANNLNENDIVFMASRALKRAPDELVFDNAEREGSRVKSSKSQLLAPNGKPSNLNAMQYAQVRTAKFKDWFGDWINDPENSSKVVDENGEPLVVYHGTNGDFSEFKDFGIADYENKLGFYFAKNASYANRIKDGSVTMPVFLNSKKPKEFDKKIFRHTVNTFLNSDDFSLNKYDGLTGEDFGSNGEPVYAVFHPTQIKSATGNNGKFDASNNDIRFSKAHEKNTSPLSNINEKNIFDRTEQKIRNSKTGKFLNKLPHWFTAMGTLADRDDYLIERYKTLGRIDSVDRLVHEIFSTLRKASKEDAAAIYDFLTLKDALPNEIHDPNLRMAAQNVKDVIITIGEKMVERGLLTQEVYEANKGAYLPRLYLKHILGNELYESIGTGKNLSDLGYLKKRKDIPEEVRRLWLMEIKNPAYLASRSISVTMRDLAIMNFFDQISNNEKWVWKQSLITIEVDDENKPTAIFDKKPSAMFGNEPTWEYLRDGNIDYKKTQKAGDKLGKSIRKVTPYFLAKEAERMRRQSVAAPTEDKAEIRALADTLEQAANNAIDEMVQEGTPKDFVQMPDSARYGALRGLVIRKEIYDDIVGVFSMTQGDKSTAENWLGDMGILAQLSGFFKTTHVVLNPPTQVVNFISNLSMIHLSGVAFHKVPVRMIQSFKEITNNGEHYQALVDMGGNKATFSNQELRRMNEYLLEAEAEKSGEWTWHDIQLLAAKVLYQGNKVVTAAGNVHQFMEMWSKTAVVIDKMEKGMAAEKAVLAAHDALIDYSLVSRNVRYLRNVPLGAPFITFFVKSSEILLDTMINRPWKFLPYYLTLYAMQLLVASMADTDKDDVDKLSELLPKWIRDKGHAYILPFKDSRGDWQGMDFSKFLPWGTQAAMLNLAARGEVAQAFEQIGLLGTPIAKIISAYSTNTDSFTERPIVDKYGTPTEQIGDMLRYAYNTFTPPFLKVNDKNQIDLISKTIGELNKYGELKKTKGQALAYLFGANARSVTSLSREQELARFDYAIADIKRNWSHEKNDRNLSQDDIEEIDELYKARIERVKNARTKYMLKSDVSSKLMAR